MSQGQLRQVGELLRERNIIDEKIAAITQRPMVSGHLGEWIAARVFGIELENSAVTAAIDGRFTSGPVSSRTVHVKWYLKQEGLLDVSQSEALDYYLVMTGPKSKVMSSRGQTRPWCIEAVYLFDARQLLDELRTRGVKIGIATSVRLAQWTAAEIFPHAANTLLTVDVEQAELLRLFAHA
jgi:hypothetical protein